MAHSSSVHALSIKKWSTWKVQRALKSSRKTITHLLKFHTRSAKFVKLRVAQFVLKIAYLAIYMELRGPRACGSPIPIMAPGTKLLIWKWISIFMQSEYSVVMHFSFYIHHYPLFHLTSLNMSMAFRSPKKTLPTPLILFQCLLLFY